MSPVCQLTTPEALARHAPGIRHLLRLHRDTLLDDASRSDSLTEDVELLWQNTAACMPWLWVFVQPDGSISAIGALSDIQPGRHAFLHGISHPAFRGAGCVAQTLGPLLQTAFDELALIKVKAEVETHNRGATGFCRRFGFQREALFRQDIAVSGLLRDVAVYSLSATRYREMMRPRMLSQSPKRADPRNHQPH
ncbi:GNAT family N-acetyltransferase [Vampirovibrio chlorellavorus]|uniref:GNAT family N-acetyltransferase n=1 Tax=Vampirovibrio chlorellavorus TaxID=758823 RepID=UPI0026F0FC32|nr:GNAT family protein [Vampirovibrio chlorellavorus]